jgi:hypothetical protein
MPNRRSRAERWGRKGSAKESRKAGKGRWLLREDVLDLDGGLGKAQDVLASPNTQR